MYSSAGTAHTCPRDGLPTSGMTHQSPAGFPFLYGSHVLQVDSQWPTKWTFPFSSRSLKDRDQALSVSALSTRRSISIEKILNKCTWSKLTCFICLTHSLRIAIWCSSQKNDWSTPNLTCLSSSETTLTLYSICQSFFPLNLSFPHSGKSAIF